MFKKLIALFSLVTLSIFADNIEVNAKSINAKDGVIYAKNGVEVFYQDAIIRADSASYDKEKYLLVLKGKVEFIGYKGIKEQAETIVINTKSSNVEFKELFMVSDNDIWIMSKKAKKEGDIYLTGASILSSCDLKEPLWKMAFQKSRYNKEDNYIQLYGTTVYFLDTPIFYTPYLAFSTANKRSSGMLFPLFGYSQDEGFIYEQPFFWAIAPNMDIEFSPQVRTKRSYGGYATFRFVDSLYSNGGLRVGYFKDKNTYAKKHIKSDSSHYGIEFQYDSSKLFSKYLSNDYSDGLYINAIYLNDIDYLNLQKTSFSDFGQTPLQESKFNYYLQNNDYYIGLNAKYFIDTRENINKNETLQILPSFALHKYLSNIILDNLTYSLDMHMDNYYRKQGINLKQISFSLPFEYSLSLLDDYISISFAEDIYYTKLFFDKGDFEYDKFRYMSNLHKIKLYSDLTKKYDGFIHVLQPALEYLKPGFESEEPVSIDEFNENQQKLFDVGLPQEHYQLSIGNYIYDDSMGLKFAQRLCQTYYRNKSITRPYYLGDLYNEMRYYISNWEFYNELKYSHYYSQIRESSSYISYHNDIYKLALRHTYRDILGDEDRDDLDKANEISLDFDYIYDINWNFSGALTYNINESSSKQWRFGVSYKQDCWNISLEAKREIIPRPDGSDIQNSFYMMMNFVPFATLGASL